MKLAPSLHRIGSDLVGSYLIEDGGEITVVDAGLPRFWDELINELAVMGRSLADVSALVLTHGDNDHLGFAERLRRERGVAVHIHHADADRARSGNDKPNGAAGPKKVGPSLSFLWYGARNGALRVPAVTEVSTFGADQTLDVPGSPRVVHVPGHTPGSVVFHFPHVDAVLMGDTITTRNVLTGVTGPQTAPFTLEPEVAVASLDAVEPLDATWVLPGHGPVWDGGAPAAVRQVRDAHATE
jgi:glyoxylase-like metal-dependent hydrolase (beta-lactamase superfamily II)